MEEEVLKDIKARLVAGDTFQEIGDQLGVTRANVSNFLRRRQPNWRIPPSIKEYNDHRRRLRAISKQKTPSDSSLEPKGSE